MTYLSGETIKEGDYVFYSEYNGINSTFRYADAICQVLSIDDTLYLQTLAFRSGSHFTNGDYVNVELKYANREHLLKVEIDDTFKINEAAQYIKRNYRRLQTLFRECNLSHIRYFKSKA